MNLHRRAVRGAPTEGPQGFNVEPNTASSVSAVSAASAQHSSSASVEVISRGLGPGGQFAKATGQQTGQHPGLAFQTAHLAALLAALLHALLNPFLDTSGCRFNG